LNCQQLIQQYDQAAKSHARDPDYAKAQKLRREAREECRLGNYEQGANSINEALALLDIKPAH
jgi:hypothetical protein